MNADWNDRQPIYRQIRERVIVMILDGTLKAGDALPSVRVVAVESRVNHLTVLKAYQQLADEGFVESRRGVGMFVRPDARRALARDERERFLTQEWPKIWATIERLGIKADELPGLASNEAVAANT